MITCKNVQVIYQNNGTALDDICFSLKGPTITGVIGPNGAGKSTLLKAILAITPHTGEISINGQPAKKQLKQIAYVEQKSAVDFTFPITVKECVSLGTYPEVGLFKTLKRKNWADVELALRTVRMEEFANRQISELSGGQFQRVLLARCLVQKADYIFLDEPFVGIDAISEQIIMETLRRLKNAGKTILIVHHDLSKVREYFDQLIILNKRLVASGRTNHVFQKEALVRAYGENIFVDEVNKNDRKLY
ncbi:metal ABC transporter ATP-binding protein [Listeria ilorinensis]|uniref:metal ABC transporter ATP-binding protein n=1 Tax=Listeria ilorinensis TaxID=2867439 RepID=UPI001EF4FD64|nr:metal ABC transporter ATP-binding protein [Listeria ilorinensis]